LPVEQAISTNASPSAASLQNGIYHNTAGNNHQVEKRGRGGDIQRFLSFPKTHPQKHIYTLIFLEK